MLVCNVSDTSARLSGCVYDITGPDCWAQNGGTHSCVLTTFKYWFLTDRKRNHFLNFYDCLFSWFSNADFEHTRRKIKQKTTVSLFVYLLSLSHQQGPFMFASFVSLFTNARCSDTLPFHHAERGGVRTTYGCRVEMSTFGPETSGSCSHPAHAQSVVRFIFKLAKNLLRQYFH